MPKLLQVDHEAVVRRDQMNTRSKMDYMRKNPFLYLLMAPAFILTIIFKYMPMYGAIIAFKDFSPIKGFWEVSG